VDRACGTYRRQERCIHGFGENTRKRDGRIILRWILKKGDGEA
jgi:hypothetical protein